MDNTYWETRLTSGTIKDRVQNSINSDACIPYKGKIDGVTSPAVGKGNANYAECVEVALYLARNAWYRLANQYHSNAYYGGFVTAYGKPFMDNLTKNNTISGSSGLGA